jgi:hypothetical protein
MRECPLRPVGWTALGNLKFSRQRHKPSPALGGVRVVGAQVGLADRQGPLVQATRAGQVALVAQDTGEVIEGGGSVEVGAPVGLVDDQGPLVQASGTGQVALIVQDRDELVRL